MKLNFARRRPAPVMMVRLRSGISPDTEVLDAGHVTHSASRLNDGFKNPIPEETGAFF